MNRKLRIAAFAALSVAVMVAPVASAGKVPPTDPGNPPPVAPPMGPIGSISASLSYTWVDGWYDINHKYHSGYWELVVSGRVQTNSRIDASLLAQSHHIHIRFWGDDLLSDDYLGSDTTYKFEAQSDGLHFEYRNALARDNNMFDEDTARGDCHDEVYAGVHLRTAYPDLTIIRSVQTNVVSGYF